MRPKTNSTSADFLLLVVTKERERKPVFLGIQSIVSCWGESEGLAVEGDTQDELAGGQPTSQPVVHSVVLHK